MSRIHRSVAGGLAAIALAPGAGAMAPALARTPAPDHGAPAQGTPRATAAAESGTVRGKRKRIRGSLGYGRIYAKPPRVPAALRRRLEQRFKAANPGRGGRPAGGTAPGPQTPPTGDGSGEGPRSSHGPHNPPPQPGDGEARTTARPPARAAATGDFTLFRSEQVADGRDGTILTRQVSEPSVANDRNGLLFTGNDFAAISADNGITWNYVSPFTQFPASDGGFCCDQVAYAIDRGSKSIVLWLLQYFNDGDLTPSDDVNGRLRLAIFQGRSKLLGGENELLDQADYCTVDFKPSDFGFTDLGVFDFNQMSHTKEHLYISSKVFQNKGVDADGDGTIDKTYLDGIVIRIPIDDLDDDDACVFDTTSWSGDGTDRNPSLVQGAGSFDTMYWASQDPNNDTSQILVTKVADNTTVGNWYTPEITSFLQTERSSAGLQATCVVPDGTDPCARANDDINTGYRTATEVGWFWNVRQGPGFPFPHVRGARFSIANPLVALTRITPDPDIWNAEHAFFYPSVGVNSLGHVGFVAYRAGNGKEVSARAAIVDNVTPGWASLSFNGIITSNAGTNGNQWGDFGQVRAYGDCDKTFAAAVYSMQDGNTDAFAQPRFAWFGREENGCADLAVVALSAYTLAVEVEGSETLIIGSTTRNIGSATAGASTTRYYLSRDADLSDDDLLLEDPASAPSLSAVEGSDQYGHLALPPVPAAASGTYYVLACADDTKAVAEIADANNCMVAPQTVTVTRTLSKQPASATGIRSTSSLLEWRGGGGTTSGPTRQPIEVEIEFPTRQVAMRGVDANFYLDADLGSTGGMTKIGTSHLNFTGAVSAQRPRQRPGRRRGGRRVKFRRFVQVPRGIKRRRQFIVVCLGPRPRKARCIPSRKPIYVRGVRRR